MKKNIFSIGRIFLQLVSLYGIIVYTKPTGKGRTEMSTPTKVNYTEISGCKFLKCEDTVYGPICFCDLAAWGKTAACNEEIKDVCEKEHHIIM